MGEYGIPKELSKLMDEVRKARYQTQLALLETIRLCADCPITANEISSRQLRAMSVAAKIFAEAHALIT